MLLPGSTGRCSEQKNSMYTDWRVVPNLRRWQWISEKEGYNIFQPLPFYLLSVSGLPISLDDRRSQCPISICGGAAQEGHIQRTGFEG